MNSKLEFLYYKTVEPTDHVSFHEHNCVELVYYITGTGRTEIDNSIYQYKSGSFSINLPGAAHDQEHFAETKTIYIGFYYDNIPIRLKNKLYFDNPNQVILSYLNEMKNEIMEKSQYYEIKLDNLLKSLLIEIGRLSNYKADPRDEFSYIRKFISENCSQKIDTRTLAELTGYSYHRFRYLFQKDTGLSPVQFIMQHRIEKAKNLLASSSGTVAAIAADCGFYDHSQFCSYFKNHVGVTPGRYRKHASSANVDHIST